MSDDWIVVAGMTAVTILPRVAPMLLIPGARLPKRAELWLSLIAPSIIAALLLPELILARQGGSPELSLANTYAVAALPAFLCALFTRNMLLTVVVGMSAAAAARMF